jgi:hypothetical protein
MTASSPGRLKGVLQVSRRVMFCSPTSDRVSANFPADLPKQPGSLDDPALFYLPERIKQLGASISAIGREPICGKTSASRRASKSAHILEPAHDVGWQAIPVQRPQMFLAGKLAALLAAFLAVTGSTFWTSNFRASCRRARASESVRPILEATFRILPPSQPVRCLLCDFRL